MCNKLTKTALVFTGLFFWAIISKAQDIIIKNDKSEIKSKVTEITEATIKYKKWENADGPVYNISKTEVFMIVYSNGQMDIIKHSNSNPPQSSFRTDTRPTPGITTQNNVEPESTANRINESLDYKNQKVQYTPLRLNVALQSPVGVGSDQEFRIIKNILNFGLGLTYYFPKDDYILESQFGFVYASLYAPINRLTGNYENQNKGLFLFGHAGYGATSIKILDFAGKTQSTTAGGFTWRAGGDYYFSKGFGVTVSAYEGKSFFAGILFSF
ncbi:MAG: hypothetical protein ABIO55_12805 [Ginsengibacter sp.]